MVFLYRDVQRNNRNRQLIDMTVGDKRDIIHIYVFILALTV